MNGIRGWLLVYLLASIPLIVIYAVGLSGAVSDYPLVLMLANLFFFAIPLWLILSKSPTAPQWNIAMLWIMALLMSLRSVAVLLLPFLAEEPTRIEGIPVIAGILPGVVAFSLGWAIVWTKYFKESVRVRNTFC